MFKSMSKRFIILCLIVMLMPTTVMAQQPTATPTAIPPVVSSAMAESATPADHDAGWSVEVSYDLLTQAGWDTLTDGSEYLYSSVSVRFYSLPRGTKLTFDCAVSSNAKFADIVTINTRGEWKYTKLPTGDNDDLHHRYYEIEILSNQTVPGQLYCPIIGDWYWFFPPLITVRGTAPRTEFLGEKYAYNAVPSKTYLPTISNRAWSGSPTQ